LFGWVGSLFLFTALTFILLSGKTFATEVPWKSLSGNINTALDAVASKAPSATVSSETLASAKNTLKTLAGNVNQIYGVSNASKASSATTTSGGQGVVAPAAGGIASVAPSSIGVVAPAAGGIASVAPSSIGLAAPAAGGIAPVSPPSDIGLAAPAAGGITPVAPPSGIGLAAPAAGGITPVAPPSGIGLAAPATGGIAPVAPPSGIGLAAPAAGGITPVAPVSLGLGAGTAELSTSVLPAGTAGVQALASASEESDDDDDDDQEVQPVTAITDVSKPLVGLKGSVDSKLEIIPPAQSAISLPSHLVASKSGVDASLSGSKAIAGSGVSTAATAIVQDSSLQGRIKDRIKK